MRTTLNLFLVSVLLLPALAAAQTPADLSVIDETSVMIERLSADPVPPNPAPPPAPGGNPISSIKNIVNLAVKIFKIIEKNRPVVNITTDYANAVPDSVTNWTQLTGWQGPDSRTYAFSAKNAAGMEIVKASYKVHFLWGGSYRGKGAFLTGVTIEPVSVVTAWGCKLDMTADVPDAAVVNAGTDEDPVASMDLHLKWKLKTFTQNVEKEAVYRVRGDGGLLEIGPLFGEAREARSEAALNAAAGKIREAEFD